MSDELKLKITVDKDGAVSGIKEVENAEKDLQNETTNTGLKFTELNSILELGQKAFQLVSAAAKATIEAIKEGSRIDDVATAFERLSVEAGTTSDVFLNELKAATGGTIRDFELMLQANESLKKGLTPDQFSQVAAAARELSDNLGTDLVTEMDVLSRALETGNARILQNKIGIVDLDAAEKEYAQTLGIKESQLSKEQKLMIARQEIMEAMNDEAQRGREIEADNADLIDQIATSLGNQADAAKRSLGANKDLNDALKFTRDLINTTDFTPMINGLNSLVVVSVRVANVFIESFVNIRRNIDLTKFALEQYLFEQYSAVQAAPKLREQFLAIISVLKPTQENLIKAASTLKQLQDEYIATKNALIESGASQDKINLLIAEGNFEVAKLRDRYVEWKNSIDEAAKSIEKIPDKINKEVNLVVTGGTSIETPQIVDATRGRQNTGEQTNAIADQFKQEMTNALVQGIGAGFDSLVNGGNSEDFKAVSKQFGAQAGQAAGTALGTIVGGPLGGAIGGQLGNVLGEKLGKGIFNAINHVFGGGRDPGTKMRKNIESFFDNLLKDADLRIIKDDQLIKIEEFDRLGDAFEEDWVGHFKQIAGESTNTFSAIGEGFSGLFDDAESFGGQIGYILAENLGGSLNNLQLMFYKTGLSAEELGSRMVDAFLDGQLSADQFTAAMAGIQQVMTDGIPDGIGMTVQALENLVASSGRGIASIDAVKDIIFEGMEAGATTFDELKANLLAAGASAEQVEALFATFSKLNISSFEQITGASNEFLINLIANLDDAGFQFATLSTDVDDLAEKLDDLEREREIPVTLTVTTRADDAARRIIDSGNLPGVP